MGDGLIKRGGGMTEPVGKLLLHEMAERVGQLSDKLPDTRLSGFLAMKGAAYQGELMWVGRAVNGWRVGRTPKELAISENVSAFVDEVAADVATAASVSECKLRWVTDSWARRSPEYSAARSAFWRVAKQVVSEIIPSERREETWPSHIIWSNLYKLSPAAGWNPNGRLSTIQLPFCQRLLMEEVSAFRPKHFVFATGAGWAGHFTSLPCFVNTAEIEGVAYVHAIGDIMIGSEHIGRYVVADHPMRKDETAWVRGVLGALTP